MVGFSPRFGFGFTPTKGGGAAVPWTPATLFASGQKGEYYDPLDLTTLWKNTAGTDPITADGDQVALVKGLSPNAVNLPQATSTFRPLFKTSGGVNWLQGDGTDDRVGPTAFASAIAQPYTIVLGFRLLTVAGDKIILDSAAASNRLVGPFTSGVLSWRVSAGTSVAIGSVVPDTADHLLTMTINGAASTARWDGSPVTLPNPGTNAMGGITFFANYLGNGAAASRLYRAIVVEGALSAGDITEAETWVRLNMPT